jgi:hypothetical protein
MRRLIYVLIAQILIHLILKVKNANAQMNFLMKVMEDVLLVIFHIIGIRLQVCVIHVQGHISTVKRQESAFALKNYPLIMDFNV